MTILDFPQVIRRAERMPDGRIKGVSPPILHPKVVRHLTTAQLIEIQGIQLQKVELNKKMWRLLYSWGLNPRVRYRVNGNGDVIKIGNYTAKY